MNFERVPGIWFGVSGACYVFGLLLCFALAPMSFTAGFAAGGGLVVLNLWASGRKVRKAEFRQKGREIPSLLGHFYVRLVILGIGLFMLIKYAKVDSLGLVAGLSVVPAGLFIMLFLIYLANRTPEEV
jgi:hypothetical protein